MAYKTDAADLHRRYPVLLEVGWILTLLVLIGAFRSGVRLEGDFRFPETERERITLEEVQSMEIEPPPPPPEPPVPVLTEAISEEVIEDVAIGCILDLELHRAPAPYEPPAKPDEPEASREAGPFVAVERQPELIGGRAAVQRAVQYPEFVKKAGLEGRVIVQFTVDENGHVQQPRILRGVHRVLNREALRAVQQMRFVPGRQRGQAVPVQMALPVVFQLR